MKLNDYERDHLDRLRPGLAGCTVLLKQNGSFPLRRPGTLAAFGSGVRHTLKGGTGSGEVNSRFFITVEQGLLDAGFTLTTQTWLDGYDAVRTHERARFVESIKRQAEQAHMEPVFLSMGAVMPEPEYDLPLTLDSEAAIYVLSRVCGEGSDRRAVPGDYLLTESEIRDILALNAAYERFMLVLNVGAPVDLTPVAEVGNILLLSQLGVETGRTLAELLLGQATPSGKLSASWAGMADWCPELEFGNQDDTRYQEGVYVGYRYYDSVGKKLQFPFGYGLSYTTFALTPGQMMQAGTTLTVEAEIANTGRFAGRETAQLYVSVPSGQLDQPYQMLAAFAKTKTLAPGQRETLRLHFDLRDCASYDESRGAYVLEAGDYILRLGTSSVDTKPVAVLALDGTAVVRCVRPILPDTAWKDTVYNTGSQLVVPDDVPKWKLSAEEVEEQPSDYDHPDTILPEVLALSDEELAYLNIGGFAPEEQSDSIVGAAGQSVCGAAGETTHMLESKGVPALVMADGPAGLRLSPQFYRDESGLHSLSFDPIMTAALEFMPPEKRPASVQLPQGAKLEEQYTTAIPIGTALAQSWDVDFAEVCGDLVGAEMERFGVHLWLAPALNIQRSPLCGRNYEYFSEDPLLSGAFAAALTRGVQRHPGRGVTVKHFAANNQETNRLNSSSNLSERALREIYLRGFEECIRNSHPKAVMTSYNLLNGVHTSEMRTLVTDYLRGETQFDGIVMTDWVVDMPTPGTPKYRGAEPVPIAAAGGDLMMPGGKTEYQKVLTALQNGALSRDTLRASASRVIAMARELTGEADTL